jgi:serine/threonine protein kinase
MAPEMVKQEEYNRSVDWWALGVLIYELVTGTPPFNNATGKDNSQEHIIRRIRRREPKYPKWFTPELVDLLQV